MKPKRLIYFSCLFGLKSSVSTNFKFGTISCMKFTAQAQRLFTKACTQIPIEFTPHNIWHAGKQFGAGFPYKQGTFSSTLWHVAAFMMQGKNVNNNNKRVLSLTHERML